MEFCFLHKEKLCFINTKKQNANIRSQRVNSQSWTQYSVILNKTLFIQSTTICPISLVIYPGSRYLAQKKRCNLLTQFSIKCLLSTKMWNPTENMLHFDVNNVWAFGRPKCSGLWLHIEVFGTPRNVGILLFCVIV